ncbi:WAT1-related protein At3g28050-like [Vicia villosa]|uniref:WAT1-related protein At3g28050-like n=1 Tax=Vicia villosa TaxID=3911 RepID=UPI00273B74D3|nr:WAT1-related protein At3g28050-like [Vicia villosa]
MDKRFGFISKASAAACVDQQQQCSVPLIYPLWIGNKLNFQQLISSYHLALTKFDLKQDQRVLLVVNLKSFMKLKTWPVELNYKFMFLARVFGYAGIYYSSSTLATTMLNLIPDFTFILVILFRMKQLDWKSYSSLAKSLGTIVSIVGAFIATLYKGAALLKGPSSPANLSHRLAFSQDTSWMTGGSFLVADCMVASAFLTLQA